MKSGAIDHERLHAAAHSSLAVLVIGFGNALRSDDSVGVAVVARLARHFHGKSGCGFETLHQLTPEMIPEITRAQRVIFIDASVEVRPGKIRLRRIRPAEVRGITMGHRLSPDALMAMAHGLSGQAPPAWVIGVGAANLAMGDHLSPKVRRAARRLHAHLCHWIRRWCAPATDGAQSSRR